MRSPYAYPTLCAFRANSFVRVSEPMLQFRKADCHQRGWRAQCPVDAGGQGTHMHDVVAQPQEQTYSPKSPRALDLVVVILNYNTADLLGDCLQSVYASAGELNYQVCVVDNASTDNSADMVRREFPRADLIVNRRNVGYSTGNNVGLASFGIFDQRLTSLGSAPRYVLLLNPDTVLPRDALRSMVDFMDAHPRAGAAGPRIRRPDGSLDRACRRSFPTPTVSLFRMTGLSRLFPKSRLLNAYNLEYLPEDGIHQVDAVVGAFMMVRGEVPRTVGPLDEEYFMYGEDLDWAKRIKDAGWEVWYNGAVEITHVKEASSQASVKSRIDFYEAMWIFYRKHYRQDTGWLMDNLIRLGIAAKGGLDIAMHLWRYSGSRSTRRPTSRTVDSKGCTSTYANDVSDAQV